MQVSFNKRAKTFSDPDVTDVGHFTYFCIEKGLNRPQMRAALEDITRTAVPGTYLGRHWLRVQHRKNY